MDNCLRVFERGKAALMQVAHRSVSIALLHKGDG